MSDHIAIIIALPKDVAVSAALEEIAIEIDDEDSGHVRVNGHDIDWRIRRPGDGVKLDPRQREAAALLLLAFDLPQFLMAASQTMLEAADISPGMTMKSMGARTRKASLLAAKALIDEMLADEAK